jgi:hypothetical protein
MAHVSHFNCDVCGIHKKVSNKWFLVEASDVRITILGFDSKTAKLENVAALCGENCLQRYLSQKLVSLHARKQVKDPGDATPESGGMGAPVKE